MYTKEYNNILIKYSRETTVYDDPDGHNLHTYHPLIYADWLEDRGKSHLANFIRKTVEQNEDEDKGRGHFSVEEAGPPEHQGKYSKDNLFVKHHGYVDQDSFISLLMRNPTNSTHHFYRLFMNRKDADSTQEGLENDGITNMTGH